MEGTSKSLKENVSPPIESNLNDKKSDESPDIICIDFSASLMNKPNIKTFKENKNQLKKTNLKKRRTEPEKNPAIANNKISKNALLTNYFSVKTKQ